VPEYNRELATSENVQIWTSVSSVDTSCNMTPDTKGEHCLTVLYRLQRIFLFECVEKLCSVKCMGWEGIRSWPILRNCYICLDRLRKSSIIPNPLDTRFIGALTPCSAGVRFEHGSDCVHCVFAGSWPYHTLGYISTVSFHTLATHDS